MAAPFTPVDLTAFGSPVLYDGEIEHLVVEGVDLHIEDDAGALKGTTFAGKKQFREGHARLTTYRLLWIDASHLPKKGDSCALHLAAVSSISPPDVGVLGIFNKKAKLRLRVSVTPSAAATGGPVSAAPTVGVSLIFRSGRHDDFYTRLIDAAQQREWRHAPTPRHGHPAQPQPPFPGHTTLGAGQVPAPLQPYATPAGGPVIVAGARDGAAYLAGPSASSAFSVAAVPSQLQGGMAAGQGPTAVLYLQPQQGSMYPPQPPGGMYPLQPGSLGAGAPGGGGQNYGAVAAMGSGVDGVVMIAGVGAGGGIQPPLGGPPVSTFTTSKAGVAGILRREERQMAATSRAMEEAFEDLSSLMAKARDMVRMAEHMRERLLEKERDGAGRSSASSSSSSLSSLSLSTPGGASASDPGREEGEGSAQEMQDWLLSMGIANPVTRDTAGSLYHQELSRQLAGFLNLPLKKAGGIMALPDAYCLFNRARGTELISPEDLVKACEMWGALEVPFQLRKFDSGVLVVQAKSHSDDQVCEMLSRIVRSSGGREGINLKQAAAALGVAIALAKEHLLMAEARGLLCRDESLEGLCFHHNFFRDIKMQACRVAVQ